MVGETVSHYRILEKLGGGGMGVVYRAEDTRLGRPVAVKFLPEELAEDIDALRRFRQEAETSSRLNHPHICTVHDIGEHEGKPFLVMELMEGRTLKHEIEARPMPTARILRLGVQIADALQAAHEADVVHRDIKPANLFVTRRGDAKVLDFGLAKRRSPADEGLSTMSTEVQAAALTAPGATVGTIAYMSPEQARGEELDARTDLFSLGLVLYEMATGRPAFQGSTAALIFNELLGGKKPTPASQQNPQLPTELDLVLAKALEKDRDLRYQSAKELLSDLLRLRRDADGEHGASSRAHAPPDRRSGAKTPSLAVVPFANLSDDPAQDYFAKGLWADINADLVKLSGLHLVSQTSTQLYATRDVTPRQVADELDVRYVLLGTARKAGNLVRITAELVDTEIGKPIWADRFDGELDELFTLQDRVTEEIVTALDIELVHGEASRLSRRSIKSPKARDYFYRALPLLLADKPEDLHEAQRLLAEASRHEPKSPVPPSFSAWSHYWEVHLGLSDTPEETLARADALADQAIELDDPSGFAYMLKGTIHLIHRQHAKALEATELALAHRPSCPWAYALKGNICNYTGKPRQAVDLARRAIRLTPLFPPLFPAVQATGHYLCGQPAEAIAAAGDAIRLAPESLETQVMLAAALATAGETESLQRTSEEIRRIDPDFSIDGFLAGQPYEDTSILVRLAADLRSAGLS